MDVMLMSVVSVSAMPVMMRIMPVPAVGLGVSGGVRRMAVRHG